MKAIFFLDSADEAGKIVEKNVRAVEVDPAQKLSLRQKAPNQTWLSAPHPDGNPEHVVEILAFPVGLKKDPTTPEESTAEVKALITGYLRSQGVNGKIVNAAADLTSFIAQASTELMSAPPAAPAKAKKTKKRR